MRESMCWEAGRYCRDEDKSFGSGVCLCANTLDTVETRQASRHRIKETAMPGGLPSGRNIPGPAMGRSWISGVIAGTACCDAGG
ncbi:MAG: hypothetical protein NC543_00425 [bacterium]|nr:hypothetical protein [bacterium]